MSENNKKTPVVQEATGVVSENNLTTEEKAKADAEALKAKQVADEKAKADAEALKAKQVADEKAKADAEALKAKQVAEDVSIIPSGRFISSNGDEFEFTVNQFAYKGKLYSKEDALSDHADVLEQLALSKSFILNKL